MELNRRDFIKFGATVPIALLPPRPEAEVEYGLDLDAIFWTMVYKRVDNFHINYRGILLKDHPALQKRTDFAYTVELFSNFVAQAWGVIPSEFYHMARVDQIELSAWYIADAQMKLVEAWELENKARRKRRGKGGAA